MTLTARSLKFLRVSEGAIVFLKYSFFPFFLIFDSFFAVTPFVLDTC